MVVIIENTRKGLDLQEFRDTLKKFAENTANDEEYSSFHPDYANLVLPDYSNE